MTDPFIPHSMIRSTGAYADPDPLPSFKDFLLKDRWNKRVLWMAAVCMLIQFIVFKYFYPYASFIHGDSFVYLETAYHNLGINSYMVGYSMFLRLFSVFAKSDTALVAFQYILMQCSVIFLIFTIFYFYRPRKLTRIVILCFMIFNPLFLFMANLVSSDPYFLFLSLIWFTLLLWILHRPSIRLIIWHAMIVFLAFTVRYNALTYLIIAAIAFMISNQVLWRKLAGVLAGGVLIGLFVLYTGNQYKMLTGNWQYSPFASWLLANNAMYAYRYVQKADRKPVPEKFRRLDNMIRLYFDSTRDTKKYPLEAIMASTYYMWSPGLPLCQYKDSIFKKDSLDSELKKWSSMGPLYKSYGSFIIQEYPFYFLRYFVWPNANRYYAPPVEFLEAYNSGNDSVAPIAKIWFGYKSRRVVTRTKSLTTKMLDFYPILSGIINVVMLFGSLFFLLLKGLHENGRIRKVIVLAFSFWLLNAGFTITASAAALRFQSFPILLTAITAALLVDWIWQMAMHGETESPDKNSKERLLGKYSEVIA